MASCAVVRSPECDALIARLSVAVSNVLMCVIVLAATTYEVASRDGLCSVLMPTIRRPRRCRSIRMFSVGLLRGPMP